jgi:hypothetical protein
MKSANRKSGNRIQKTQNPPNRSFDKEKSLRLFCDATSQELATVLAAVVGELDFALASISPASR